MKNLTELLSIYAKAYKHYRNDDVYEKNEDGQFTMLTEFANMIATDPFSDLTQKTALDRNQDIDDYHVYIIKSIEKGKYKVYPCECMKPYIREKVNELKKKMDENYYESDEESDESDESDEESNDESIEVLDKKSLYKKYYKQYNKWLYYT